MKKYSLFLLIGIGCYVNGTTIDIVGKEEKLNQATNIIFSSNEAIQKNNNNLVDRLLEEISYNRISDDFGANSISFRGLDYRATNFSEDLIPQFKTSTQNTVLSNIFNLDDEIISNAAKVPSLFGVSSIGGDFEIRTSKPKKKFEGAFYTVLSKESNFNKLSVNSKQKYFYIKTNFSYYNRNNFTLSKDFKTTAFQPNKTRLNSDKENRSAYIKIGYLLSNSDEIAFKYINSKASYGNEPQIYGDNWYDYTRVDFQNIQSFYAYYDKKKKNYDIYLRAYFDKYEDLWKIYNDDTYTSLKKQPVVYDDQRLGILSKLDFKKENSRLGFVFNYEENKHITKRDEWKPSIPKYKYQNIKSSILYIHIFDDLIIDSALTYKKYKPLEIDYDGHIFSSSANGSSGDIYDGQISLDYSLNNENILFATYARTSKIPSMKEMFAFSDYIEPNPNLKAEKSNNIEIGFRNKSSIGLISSSIYNYNLKDKIQLIDRKKYININKAKHQGLEFKYMNIFENNQVNFAYAYSKTKDDDGKKIDLIPRHKIKLSNKIDISKKLSSIIEVSYQSKMYKNQEKDLIKAFTLVNLYTTYSLTKKIKSTLSIKNILDKNYEYDYGMPASGREYYLSLNYAF